MPSIDAIARQREDFVRTTTANVGAIAAASAGYVVPEELGDAIWHHTLLTFLALPVVTGNTTGASFGSKQVYTFPEGWLYILKVVANFNLITFNTAAGVPVISAAMVLVTTRWARPQPRTPPWAAPMWIFCRQRRCLTRSSLA
jgi:hypothetical protein